MDDSDDWQSARSDLSRANLSDVISLYMECGCTCADGGIRHRNNTRFTRSQSKQNTPVNSRHGSSASFQISDYDVTDDETDNNNKSRDNRTNKFASPSFVGKYEPSSGRNKRECLRCSRLSLLSSYSIDSATSANSKMNDPPRPTEGARDAYKTQHGVLDKYDFSSSDVEIPRDQRNHIGSNSGSHLDSSADEIAFNHCATTAGSLEHHPPTTKPTSTFKPYGARSHHGIDIMQNRAVKQSVNNKHSSLPASPLINQSGRYNKRDGFFAQSSGDNDENHSPVHAQKSKPKPPMRRRATDNGIGFEDNSSSDELLRMREPRHVTALDRVRLMNEPMHSTPNLYGQRRGSAPNHMDPNMTYAINYDVTGGIDSTTTRSRHALSTGGSRNLVALNTTHSLSNSLQKQDSDNSADSKPGSHESVASSSTKSPTHTPQIKSNTVAKILRRGSDTIAFRGLRNKFHLPGRKSTTTSPQGSPKLQQRFMTSPKSSKAVSKDSVDSGSPASPAESCSTEAVGPPPDLDVAMETTSAIIKGIAELCKEMVSVETFIEYVKKKDIARIRFALTDSHFDIDSRDEDGRTPLHHALVHGVVEGDMETAQQLIDFGSDVNIKDETQHRESPIHVALRLGSLDAVKMLLHSASFEVVKCDSFQRSKMLPEVAIINDIYNDIPPSEAQDSDCTLTKRRSFGDQYLLFVRQNTKDYMENNFPPGRESIRDLILLQDECVPPLNDLLHRIDYAQLSSLYIADCRLHLKDIDIFERLSLTVLVLSHTHLRRLPKSIFDMDTLQILKVDRNRLEEIPADIENLTNLQSFCCDSQKPRLRMLPIQSLTKLDNLQVLSFSNNRIDNISWVVALPAIRTLRCDRNRITRLPNQLASLHNLKVLDVSHNRLEYIPPCYTELIKRLYKFEFYNLTLRPKHIRHDRQQLLSYLELENFLLQSPGRRAVRDVTVGIVGESHAGKSTLVDALMSDKGLSKTDLKHESTFDMRQFEMLGGDSGCFISTIVFANDFLDNYCRNINVDLFILVIDLTLFEMQNGSQHIFARHVSRLLTWLQALYEIAPETPVLMVGTHAEMVKTLSFSDIWTTLREKSIELGRAHHIKRFADCRINHCLLCAPKDLATRHCVGKSRFAGFVDLSFPRAEPLMNGHVQSGGEEMKIARARLPHVVGYYEVDCKKNFPKDAKKSNVSIDQLKAAIVRLTASTTEEGIPPFWMNFLKHIATQSATLSCPIVTYDEVVNISRRMDIPPQQVPFMLQYFHQRGKLIFFDGDEVLTKLVVINPMWLIHKMRRVLDSFNCSRATLVEMVEALRDNELDKQLQKNGVLNITSSHWLLSALQRLHFCVPFLDTKDFKLFLLPNLLEVGHPSADVWPDLPEWDEKQITCDYSIRQIKPALFSDLMLSLNKEGRRLLEIVDDPAPVFLSHHIVFFTGIDIGGCADCFANRQRCRVIPEENVDTSTDDDILHKVHIQLHPRMSTIRIAVRGSTPCCTIKNVLNFLELYLDDRPEEDADASSDKTSLSSHALSSGSASASHSGHSAGSSDRLSMTSSHTSEDDEDRQFFLLCPKCVLLRHTDPERISYTSMSNKRKAICSKWHNLGSWSRAVTGDYRFNDHHVIPNTMSSALTQLPDYEHPRLVLVLPPSASVTCKDWYMFNKMKFLEGFEVHFLCEYTGYWHMTDDSGFRLNQSPEFIKRFGNQVQSILQLALPMVQVVNGVPEHGLNGRLLAPVISDLIKTYEYLKHVDAHIADPYTWLTKNKDRVVTMLTKVLANVNDGVPDLYFKVGNAINADMVFQMPSTANRLRLARFLRIESSSGRFGPLRPLYVGREVRWLCDTHYEELRSMPSN